MAGPSCVYKILNVSASGAHRCFSDPRLVIGHRLHSVPCVDLLDVVRRSASQATERGMRGVGALSPRPLVFSRSPSGGEPYGAPTPTPTTHGAPKTRTSPPPSAVPRCCRMHTHLLRRNLSTRRIVFETVLSSRAHPQEVTWPRELYLNVLGCKALVPQSAVGEGGPLTATASVTTDGENGDAAAGTAAASVVLSGVGGDTDANVNPERATPPPGMSRKLSY